ncbi:MAG TPA: AraC family transcriptional regulator, partial [Spirochaetia bacterium]|nr:AraC family transcriptional regulator [Spirochaetia bacterium]
SLPPVVIVPGATHQASELRVNIQRFAAEFQGSGLGRSLIMHQLAPVILVDLIRTYLSETPGNFNWFSALSEGDLSRVLNLMHTEYQRPWTLEELAVCVGVSRSKLAARFKSGVGISPMEYLCRWRMEVARDVLANEEMGIAEVCRMVGYESESAFSAAFKRVHNKRPGYYQKRRPPENRLHRD